MLLALGTVDKIFFSLIFGGLLLCVILYFVFKYVDSKKGEKPADALTHKSSDKKDE